MTLPAKVMNDALSLPREQRAELATTLLRSLDDAEEDAGDVEAAWAAEIDRRIANRDAGRSGSAPLESTLKDLAAKLAADREPENR